MGLRDGSQDAEQVAVTTVKIENLQPVDSGSNESEQTAGSLELSPSVGDDDLPPMPPATKKMQAPPVKKKIGRRKRKSAEEKAASVRARNRRAQQAFRKRQKALSQEKNESMAILMEEVDELRETNRALQNTIDSLLQQLDSQEILRMDHANVDSTLLTNASLPMLVEPSYMGNGASRDHVNSMNTVVLPDILTDNSVPDLLQGLDFGDPF